MGTTPRSGRDSIRYIDGITASASLQVSHDGGPLNNEIFVEKQMGKEADLMFTVNFVMPFWGLGEHEPLIIDLFLPVFSCRNWRRPCKIKGSDWTYGTFRPSDLDCKRECDWHV